MYKLCILNSVIPKLQPQPEQLIAITRNWFTDGYRAAAPGTHLCQTDTDCEHHERCQSGYCAGLHRTFGSRGINSAHHDTNLPLPLQQQVTAHSLRYNY